MEARTIDGTAVAFIEGIASEFNATSPAKTSLNILKVLRGSSPKLFIRRDTEFTLRHVILLLLAATLALQTGCESKDKPPAAPPKVTVSRPIVQEIIEWDEYTGRLEATENVEVRARVSGYLQSIHFKDGAMVKKGELLFVIDPRPYQAEVDRVTAELHLAQARLELAKSDYARAQKLLQFHAISQEEADTRAAAERQAQEAVEAGRAAVKAVKLNVEFTGVTAPISGRISRRLVTEGNLINGGTAESTLLTTIVSLDPIYVYFEADERSYLKYVRLSQNGKRPSSRDARNPVYLALAAIETGQNVAHVQKRIVSDVDLIVTVFRRQQVHHHQKIRGSLLRRDTSLSNFCG